MKPYFVYLLSSLTKSRTYVGCTYDLKRRLRQHNGEITGGAKHTKYGRPWKMLCYVAGFPTRRTALQFEWRMNYDTRRKRLYSVRNRIRCLYTVMEMDKVTKTCVPTSEMNLNVVWLENEL